MLHQKVRSTIRKYDMLQSGDRVLVGVSGGPDSVALLHFLFSLRGEFDLSLHVAHLNHQFRAREAELDARYVELLAQHLGVPCTIETFDIPAFISQKGLSPENGARRVRYNFFDRVSGKIGATKVALGHTADDQTETILMRLIRGSGSEGLMGILPVRDRVIHPLIEVTKEEVKAYLKEHNLSSRLDASNLKPIYLRNKIRLKLLPLLAEEYNPSIRATLLRTAQILGQDNDYFKEATREALRSVLKGREAKKVTLDLNKFRLLHKAIQRRILREAVALVKGDVLNIGMGHIDDILGLIRTKGSARIDLPDGLVVVKEYEELYIYLTSAESVPGGGKALAPFKCQLKVPGKTLVPQVSLEVITEAKDLRRTKIPKEEPTRSAYFDLEKVDLPLYLRNRRRGDKFQPLGMAGTKKIKDFFIDQKIRPGQRESIPLLATDREVLWVVGYRRSELAKVTPATKRLLRVEVRQAGLVANPLAL